MTNKYDIFISYRRTGGAQYARILQLMLTQRGYKVFLDYDELTDGIFGEHIKTAIKDAPVFMLVLSENSLARCMNEDDWVRQEILLAVKEGRHFIPINPDNTFDGVPSGIPEEIKTVASSHQHSDISFGQTLGVTIDFMVEKRLVPTLGKRTPANHVDTSYDAAQETLKKIEAHQRFMKRLGISGTVAALIILLGACGLFWHHYNQKEQLEDFRSELEKKYSQYNLHLAPYLSMLQMRTIDDILYRMEPVNDSLWISQFECTRGWWFGILDQACDDSEKDLPVAHISFGEVYSYFIGSLREMTQDSVQFDLPSTEEWQLAARGGLQSNATLYAGSNDADSVAWYRNNSGGQAHPSNGQTGKNCNGLNLFDMSGNVSELCNTPYDDKGLYTICGGNYDSPASEVTITSCAGIDTNAKDDAVGFRLIIRK